MALQECEDVLSGLTSRGVRCDAAAPQGPGLRATLEAINMAALAGLIARFALARAESRGSHYRSDCPRRDDERFGTSSFLAPGDRSVRIAGLSGSR
jgi:succinate dehydrogenase/fumarate reductase flavoprotein subunit